MELQVAESNGHKLTFNEKSHRYSLDGKPISGVTTANKQGYPESHILIGWKIGEGAKFAIKKINELRKEKKKITQKVISEVVKESKSAFRKRAAEAADIGTVVHDYAYCYERGIQFDMARVEQHTDRNKIELCLGQFIKWKSGNKDELVMSEEIIASPHYWFAGKFDRYVKREGKFILSDFKTSRSIYAEYFVQLAGYKIALEEWLGVKVDGLEVLRFGKDGSFEPKLITDPHDIAEYTNQFIRNIETYKFRRRYEGD